MCIRDRWPTFSVFVSLLVQTPQCLSKFQVHYNCTNTISTNAECHCHCESDSNLLIPIACQYQYIFSFAFYLQAQNLFALFEHAVGYGLFQVKEFDEMALLAPRVEQSVLDLGKFNSLVKTIAFAPFKSGHNALDNMNSISEGLYWKQIACEELFCVTVCVMIVVVFSSFFLPIFVCLHFSFSWSSAD